MLVVRKLCVRTKQMTQILIPGSIFSRDDSFVALVTAYTVLCRTDSTLLERD